MTQFDRPLILPDEIAWSYDSWFRRINFLALVDYQNEKKTGLAAGQDTEGFKRVLLLAQSAGLSISEFTSQHSMVTLSANATRSEWKKDEKQGKVFHHLRPFAYWCKKCAELDLQKYIRSYWRRTHQIPGIYWCHIHTRIRLSRAPLDAYETQPIFAESALPSEAERTMIDNCRTHPAIPRYLRICQVMLYLQHPFVNRSVRFAILRQSARSGFKIEPNLKGADLADEVLCTYPSDWLSGIANLERLRKNCGQLLGSTVPYMPGYFLALIGGSLWKKPMDAIFAFENADARFAPGFRRHSTRYYGSVRLARPPSLY